ncbi:hypothetical protein E2C01_011933 [Portunus trituberculatus]|uniref:Uncharacterized protein n=1 Tax=Portunus trituberculatus TaxID=210409 RepID=A0A5B7DCS5_PORTR|nr:hypothetical protein [Portunus trituberculatus]
MSAVTRFKQSVSQSRPHRKERKAHQPLPTSVRATPRSVLTCIAYVDLVTTSALGVGLPLRPWNISCFIAHASSLNILHYAPGSPPQPSQHSTCPPSWRPQAYTSPGNLLSFALFVPFKGRPASYHACDTHTGLPQGS